MSDTTTAVTPKFTAEAFLATSLKTRLTGIRDYCLANNKPFEPRREPETVFGTVMSSGEVNAALDSDDDRLLIKACGVGAISNGTVFFLSDDHCFGHGLLPHGFIGMSVVLPHRVAPREAVPDGIVRTAEQFIAVYYEGERQLSTLQELVDYLNDNH